MKKNYFLIIIFGFLISCSENKNQSVDFSIVIHGGAGTMEREKMSIEKELEYKKTLEEAQAANRTAPAAEQSMPIAS